MFANKLAIVFGIVAAAAIIVSLAVADIEILVPTAGASSRCVEPTSMPVTWYGDCDHQ